ncbi:rhodanese-like domain-containing protein [Rhodobacteraceae bacterium N5(2021)]|uniref:Rhodanese-like domain-containing protein n=1 Tax=Gymnodinialimonas phycosphaerae TaxID=2841589 RepID=A0A975YHM7_9RHOB|nr:rhodanese-like domain-containing protein [Gymnodinialimonas phycosphaerae]MBY4892990.1 rhodanese-like domain-containing protein [Gymnodinialimonas phycosphaerae]
MDRRRVLIGAGALALVGGAFAATEGRNLFYSALSEGVDQQIDVTTAHTMASAGEILLIDIRRPDEWAATGSPVPSHRLDMRREDFAQALLALTGGATDTPVALICARGVRSSRLTNQLVGAGFTNIMDVPEGMFGSGAGPGWIREGLPVDRS